MCWLPLRLTYVPTSSSLVTDVKNGIQFILVLKKVEAYIFIYNLIEKKIYLVLPSPSSGIGGFAAK
jgi:hypothetical protein